VLGAAVVLFLALLGVASVKSSRDLDAARGRERLLESRIHDSATRIEQLKGRIERLRHDPGALERLAREDLGMVRPGDLVIILPDGQTPRPVPRAIPAAAPASPSAAPVAARTPSAPAPPLPSPALSPTPAGPR
jgi:cell division protein FtsB